MDEEEAGKLFDEIDTDGDGMITFPEWNQHPESFKGKCSPLGDFLQMDMNWDREIGREEFIRHRAYRHYS
ncbi:hypothetical protein [Streptomyces albidus (ex Kaewkla and Franco 2022)]|uniref:hypothetical protein n=1 Tax=Streptomyces albidus (ex Kaewkla and Franco 2022) TaxID=722709 RepID=UPI0015EE62E9|nr:hypothetical protein [Streptomyces albidus (ex Kaewkla and Franco 2022)]